MPDFRMEVVERPTSELIPYARNARHHSPTQVKRIAASIQEFGFLNPVLIDADLGIIAGHGRVMAADKLGRETVPTVQVKHLSEAQKRAFIIADNRLAELSEWDEELLALELEELDGLDYDFSLTGFDSLDLDLDLGGGEEKTDDGLYTRKVEAPVYVPTGEKPKVGELYSQERSQSLLDELAAAKNVPKEVRAFLEAAAARHTKFNFAKIAEFYAHASPQIQSLMEHSALIIIDYDQAIELGFVKLTEKFGELAANAIPLEQEEKPDDEG